MTTTESDFDPASKATWKLTRQKIKGENKGYYVLNKLCYYDPKTKNTKYLESKIVGWVPSLDTPFDQMQKTSPKKKKNSAQSVQEALEQIPDSRAEHKIIYPLPLVLLVILLSTLAGFTSCVEIAAYWKSNKERLLSHFPNFPNKDISHDTIRRLIAMVGAKNSEELIKKLTEPLVRQFNKRLISFDGQAVRASRDENDGIPYVLNVMDTSNNLVLTQKLIGAKENEITHATEVLKTLEITGAVVIADALNTQKKFAAQIIEQDADFILALKANHSKLFEYTKGLFEMNAKPMLCGLPETDYGHGRIETRSVRILSGKKLPLIYCKGWIGLEEGCLIEARKQVFNKKTEEQTVECRFYISSLPFEQYDEKKQKTLLTMLSTYIRQHWSIENKTHWVLDVVFDQDRTQVINPQYLKGRTALNKIGLNILNQYKLIAEQEESKEEVSIASLQARMSNVDKAIECLDLVYGPNQ